MSPAERASSPASSSLSPLALLESFGPHDETLTAFFEARARRVPQAPWLGGEIRAWTYGAARSEAGRFAARLAQLGVVRGDRVAVVSLNSDLTPLLLLALARLGAMLVPANPALTREELAYMLGHCEPHLVIAQAESLGLVEEVAARLATAPRVMTSEAFIAQPDGDAAALAQLPPPRASDPLVMIYTSGTTGFPKGVVHSQRNYVLAAEAFVERMHLQPGERLMAILPFFHINALFYSLGGAIACGGALITTPRFSASQFWQVAARHGATQLNILAAVGNILPKRPREEFVSGHRIRKIYGGPISAEMMRAFQQDFGVPDLIEGFGMSEIPGAMNNPYEGPRKVGSIGQPARHPRFAHFAEAKVVDDEGREVGEDIEGELLVKTPIAMVEYFRDPKQTAEAFADGYLKTGDLVRRDADGYFYFVARKKDIIRRRGENIAGAELDRVIGEHPEVLEAATIGVPAALGDEDILVVVVARPGMTPTPHAIVDWCAPRLAAMKLPRYIVFADQLPHTPSQRVMKHVLKKDSALLARAWDREA